MDLWALEKILTTFCQRLNFGVKQEIIPLTEISGVKKVRARILWNAGFRTIRQVAIANPEDMCKNVNFGPFTKGIVKKIIKAAQELLEKQAKELRETANELLNFSNENKIDN